MTSSNVPLTVPWAVASASALELDCLREWNSSAGPSSKFGNIIEYIEYRKTNSALPPGDSGASNDQAGSDLDARCKRDWATSPAIRAEFRDPENYRAFRKAEAAGMVRIHR